MIDHDDERQAAAADVPEWWPRRLTRGQVVSELGVSMTSVRRMEGKTLHPAKGESGVWGFDPAQVAKHKPCAQPTAPKGATSPDGEIAAAAFRLFNEGQGFREVVTELRLPPQKVRDLYREWHEDGDLLIPRRTLSWLREMFGEMFPDEKRLLRLRNAYDLVDLFELELDYCREADETAAERYERIQELQAENRKLTARLEQLRAPSTPAAAAVPAVTIEATVPDR